MRVWEEQLMKCKIQFKTRIRVMTEKKFYQTDFSSSVQTVGCWDRQSKVKEEVFSGNKD